MTPKGKVGIQAPTGGRESVWITREGDRVPVNVMADTHLLRTLRVMAGLSPIGTVFNFREAEVRRAWLLIFTREAVARGILRNAGDDAVAILVAQRLTSC